eukprot:scaffold275309_cov18-Prasinocladus_malaysianus.AAC.2
MKSAAIYLNRKRSMLGCNQSQGNFGSFCRYYTYTSTFTSKEKYGNNTVAIITARGVKDLLGLTDILGVVVWEIRVASGGL